MELKELLNIIKKKLWFIILVSSVTTGITYSITKYYIQPQYRASSLVIIGNNISDNTNQSSYESLTQTYAQFASTRKVAEDVVNSLKLNIPANVLQGMIVAEPSKDSRFLRITVTSYDKKLVAPVANQVVTSLGTVTKNLVKPDTMQVIDEALTPTNPFSPNIRLNVMASFMIGLFISVILVFLHEYVDTTVKNEDEISQILGAPVLGIIPSSFK